MTTKTNIKPGSWWKTTSPMVVVFSLLMACESAFAENATAQDSALPITITVNPGARQRFSGLGASLNNWSGDYQKLPATNRADLSKLLWQDLHFKILRLWLNTFQFRPHPGGHDLSQFRKNYIDSGIIADAKKNGVTTLLLAPDGLPEGMKEKRADGGMDFKAGEEANYAVLLADFIKQLNDETGILLNVTGVQNEPNDNEHFTKQQLVTVVKLLRAELDTRGLQSVEIIAPEHASADDILYGQVDALKGDAAAWSGLAGVASHSYNMAASGQIADRMAGPDGQNLKAYWMTEASDNGPEEPGDVLRAAGLASRFLNDMNHRVTHWIHFIGFDVSDPRDNATRIIAYEMNPLRTVIFTKYFYYRQLAETFDPGTIFRESRSSLEGDMTWGYGKKPRLTAAAGKNPDGTWGIGLSNFTAERFDQVKNWADDKWNREQGGHTPGQIIEVTVQLPELKDCGDISFTVNRCNGALQTKSEATMRKGELTVRIKPLELVTLRSVR